MKWFIVILLLALAFTGGFGVAEIIRPTKVPDYIIEFHQYAEGQHDFYARHSERCNEYTGTAERNKELVTIYQETINILRRY